MFIDPFGATGVPFSKVEEILASKTSEILLNFDADGLNRIRKAKESANADQNLDAVFGTTEWRNLKLDDIGMREACQELSRYYRERLTSIQGVEYTFSFEMGNKAGSLDFFLIFASRHEKGLEVMKEAMKAVDRSCTYSFYDSHSGQQCLWRLDEPNMFIEPLVDQFRGQTVLYDDVRKWILCNTPLISFKRDLLQAAAKQDLLVPIGHDGNPNQNRLQFPEGKVKFIRFME